MIRIEFDPEKDAVNAAVHGISLTAAETLLGGLTVQRIDDRHDYGEVHVIAIGEIEGRIFTCVYTRRIDAYRLISLRPAHRKERYVYREAKAQREEGT